MTAPAEDPRGGEAMPIHAHDLRLPCNPYCARPVGACPNCRHRPHTGVCGYLPDDEVEPYRCQCSLSTPPPAAGRGDTDSSGERPCCGHPNALTDPLHAIPAAARPAGDRAQPTEELREALVGTLMHHSWCWIDRGQCTCRTNREQDAAALIAGPLAALLDAQAKVERVEALAKEYADRSETVADGFWKRHLWIVSQRIRSALGGTA